MPLRTEAAVSLSIVWDPRKPLTADEAPVLRRFLAAVNDLAGLDGVRAVGNFKPIELALSGVPQPPLPPPLPEPVLDMKETLAEAKRRVILSALRAAHGNQTKAAKRLEMSREGMRAAMKKLGIRRFDYEPAESTA